MPRLYRPHIPLDVRCRVALRQLGEMFPDDVIAANVGRYGALLDELLVRLGPLLTDAEIIEFELDHDPPLGARQIVPVKKIRPGAWLNAFGVAVRYEPDANDPEFLIYRIGVDHDIKTRVRGEHGQYSDLALIKREKRRSEKNLKKRRPVWRSRAISQQKRPKTRWPKRGFPKKGPRR